MTSIIDEIRAEAFESEPEKKDVLGLSGMSLLSPNEILEQLLEQIEPVNFTGFTGGGEVRAVHHRIYSIKSVVRLAECKNWGLCKRNGAVYVFTGSHWRRVEDDDMEAFLGTAALRTGVPRYRADDYKFRAELLKQFHSEAHLTQPDMGTGRTLINLQNGTFEITQSGQQLREFRRADFLTHVLPFEYREDAKAPLFRSFLERVLPDPDSQRVLAEFVGYVFIRGLKLEKALMLYGGGANGKSVFFDILLALLGSDNASSYSLASLTDSRNAYYRAMLADKLVNYASEINSKVEASIFKQIVSGEPVEARLPYGKPFILKEYAKLIFNANELPRDVEHTNAYFRRFLIIPFTVTIPEHEQDKQLAGKIIASELPGVFNWALEGLRRLLQQKNFSNCDAARHAVDQYKRESDSVQMFVDDRALEPSGVGFETLGDLYKGYKSFCADDGYRELNKRNFSKRLEACGFEKVKRGTGWGFGCSRRADEEPF
ncbi:MAG: DUF5906 domain-containing protein [Chlorobium sp.]|uniref:DNA primase family protein n=1 Tax=Chlorobium sp. TaxID=1095 RepID=UPI0025C7049D|nr:phage/plasmid primase, P4 family [Chlorobium sp.]MCF8382104.1 DUF5906 domain-containing protein [Chlorobium sp.]